MSSELINDENLQEQARQVLEQAEKAGLQKNFYFLTTFERYLTQIEILKGLKVAIVENGSTVTKEYVKGRQNIYINPAIAQYNKTATACNGTLSILLSILKELPKEEGESLADIMKGLMNE